MKRFTVALAAALALVVSVAAQDEPSLEQLATDGVRMCMSVAEGRAGADAAAIYGFATSESQFQRETARGKVEVLPPDQTRKSCRVQVSALTLDPKATLDAVAEFITEPPHSYAPLQSRIAERIGNYAARVSIWASSDGAALGMLTLYEILANEYYLGPKIMIDYVVDRR